MIKPYRLISTCELEKLTQHFNKALQQWNEAYALNACSLHLEAPKKPCKTDSMIHVIADNRLLATMDEHYLEVFNQILFGEHKSCFNSTSLELFTLLINQLFEVEQCVIKKTTEHSTNWFYKGSTCLVLNLSTQANGLNMILNPDWVYQSLTLNSTKLKNIDALDDALAEQSLTLNIELIPFNLPINQLTNIQVGDVICTDHPISSALRIVQKTQLLAEAELGESRHHKSITIKRSS